MNEANKAYDLLVANAAVVTMDKEGTVFEQGAVGIRDGQIAYVGPLEGLAVEAAISAADDWRQLACDAIDATGCILLPGFVNTHIHIFQSLLKGLGADHELVEWLNLSALPYGALATPRHHYLAAQLACMEAIRSGCTTLAEFFYTTQDPALADAVIEGMLSTGMRSVFIRTFQDTGLDYGMPASIIEPAEAAMQAVADLRGRHAKDANPLLDIWTGPDVTWSTTKEGYATMLEYCLAEQVNYSMHILETTVDNEMCQREYGCDIVDMLEQLGFLTERMLAVHCVNLTDRDIRRFAEYGVSVSHNPAPNLYLGSGVAPIAEAMQAGVNVSLGTDGAASNNTTNMLETIKLAALCQKGRLRNAAALSAAEVCGFATMGGARALHKQDAIGSIEAGKCADLIVFNPDELTSTPNHDPLATVAYASEPRNIKHSIINGRVVLRDGRFVNGVDEYQLIDEVKEAVEELMSMRVG